ncbi:helix-turn-helix domain-containing protein [bacterium]|nr:helix-turn-helix domain-containing protein [bacterium]
MNNFSKRLKQAMDEQGINQTDLATKTGLGKSSISQYISGKNEPTAFRLKMLADALDVSPAWLKGDIDEPASEAGHTNNLPVETAAKLMGVGKQMIREGLKNGTFPFGYAVLMPSGKFRYYISPKKFTEYTGVEL